MQVGEITELAIFKFWDDNRNNPGSTLKKHFRFLKEIIQLADKTFELLKFKFTNKSKSFDETQILEEDRVLDAIENEVDTKFQIPSLIACYSGLRLGNVVGLKKKDVDLKAGWIVVAQTKTKEIISIPITKKLRNVFERIKVWPLKKDHLFFQNIE